jgi:hypothetical protein
MDRNQDLFPHFNLIVGLLVATCLTLGIFVLFNADMPEAVSAQAEDAAIINQTQRADAIRPDMARSCVHLMFEKMLTIEAI